MNNTIASWIFKIGASIRNPKLFRFVSELEKTDKFDLESLSHYQTAKLAKLLQFVKKHSPYFQPLLSNFDSKEVHKHFQSLPILSKADLLANVEKMTCYAPFDKLILAETSGSTGQPFKFKKNIDWDTWNRASFIRSYGWFGVKPWEKNGYFWGYSLDKRQQQKVKFLDTLQNRFRVFNYDEEEIRKFLEKLKSASYLHGYSSMIYETAVIGKKIGFTPKDFPHLKMIKGTSEKIFDFYHPVVQEVFGLKIISEYGSAEGGIIAFECPEGNMHVNEENVIVEEIDGQAIVTNLNAFSLPIIRYNTGDSIVLKKNVNCTCGKKGAIIEEVLGRVGKKIVGKTKNFPSLTLYYIFKNISLEYGIDIQYQGFQNRAAALTLRIPKKLTEKEIQLIQKECLRYFGDEIACEIVDNYTIHNRKQKLKDFISELEN